MILKNLHEQHWMKINSKFVVTFSGSLISPGHLLERIIVNSSYLLLLIEYLLLTL